MFYRIFQIGFVFLCSTGAALAADATIRISARDGSSSTVNALVVGNSNVSISGNSARGSNTDVDVHASGHSDVNVAADSLGRGSSARSNVDVRTASGGYVKANSINQSYYGNSTTRLDAVATQRGVVVIDQVSTVNHGSGQNVAIGDAVGGFTKLVGTLIADKSQGCIRSHGITRGAGAKTDIEILADLQNGCGGGDVTGSSSAGEGQTAEAKGLTVIQNGKVHSQFKTTTGGCKTKASITGNFFAQ